jgi:hypothetical protein
VAFSQSIDPGNKAIQELVAFCSANEVTTGVFTIDDELAFNVFMRTESEVVQGESSALADEARRLPLANMTAGVG